MVQKTAQEVRNVIPGSASRKSTCLGTLLVFTALMLYLGFFYCVLRCDSVAIKLASSLGLSLGVCILFVLGHDACHGSLTPRSSLNKFLGRLCFSPTFHPYTAWEWTHNGKHHGWTNVRGKDIVYAPFSPEHFAVLPAWRRLTERVFRSIVGLGPLYFFTVFLPYEIFADGDRRPTGRRSTIYLWDRAGVLLFLFLQIGLLTWSNWPSLATIAMNFTLAFFVPQIIFQYTMGFVTFLHHTHPDVPWYSSEAEYSFFRSQVASTAHIEFPWLIEVVLHHILKHTAHHIDPKIPLYNLPEAQAAVEAQYGEVLHEPFTLSGFCRTLHCCKLYNYDHHQWVSFEGIPTSASHRLSPLD